MGPLNNFMEYKDLFDRRLDEATLRALTQASDDSRKSRSKSVRPTVYSVTKKDNALQVVFRAPGRYATYDTYVQFTNPDVDLFDISEVTPEQYASALQNSQTKVYCSCADFFLGGAKYNLGPVGKFAGNGIAMSFGIKPITEPPIVRVPPDTRDPDRKHVLCKHLIAVNNGLVSNLNIVKSIMQTIEKRKL